MLRFRLAVAALLALSAATPVAAVAIWRQAPTQPATVGVRLAASTPARNTFKQFTSDAQWRAGSNEGTSYGSGQLRFARGVQVRQVGTALYDDARWTSAWVTPGHGFSQLIPSWNARTPSGTFVEVWARARTAAGSTSSFQDLGRWDGADSPQRTSSGAQTDALSRVSTDTFQADSGVTFTAYQLRVHLARRHGTAAAPLFNSVHAVASQLASSLPATSKPLLPAKSLTLPRYSQMAHRGQYPQYGGGGEAWCSPTSLSMVLGYYDALPKPSEYAWVNPSYSGRWVDEVARRVFDHGYDGTGNWPFNTAYAATRVTQAFVTRLTDLRDAERFVANGIPLEASISFDRGQLSGAPISATAGHLVVIAGFTAAGNVVVYDPAAPDYRTVRRVYDRGQFERAWLRRSHGTVYAMRDATHQFPAGYAG